ncbi:MAG: DUF1501 domain-containing protein [Oceanospirillaceae bacterium]|nr:DUF1501 domain-containing protein [Oceanospirillaceae bacterium]MBT6076600.1 DUF1501 domain-containing protein [Oceanospirillaceae bacterium]
MMGYVPNTLANANNQDLQIFVMLLRGGMDGLASVQPNMELNRLKKIRKTCAIDSTLKLNSDFGLHPKLRSFHNMWKDNNAAVIHATGFSYDGRSHFDGQNIMEGGFYTPYAGPDGWLGRAMELKGYSSIALNLPTPLIAKSNAFSTNFYPSKFYSSRMDQVKVINELWGMDVGLSAVKDESTMAAFRGGTDRNPRILAAQVAREMNKEGGPKVGVVELSGFDTHANQGQENGMNADTLRKLDEIMSAFKNSARGELWNNSIIMTVTEFGRTVRQNGNSGTDHGIASAILLGGGAIKQSKVITDFPGLNDKDLVENRDLRQTIDSRDVYGDVLHRAFGLTKDDIRNKIFPKSSQNLDLGVFT